MNIKDIKAIDFHSHFNHGHPSDSGVDDIYECSLDFVEKMNTLGNVEACICSTFASVLDYKAIVEENEYMFEVCESLPTIWQWVVIDPRNEETFKQAERMLGSKRCLGIKVHPPLHGYSSMEYGDKIFGFANEMKAVVEIHPDTGCMMYVPFADKYPNAIIDIAHMNGDDYVNSILAAKNGNIYVDTSGSASVYNHTVENACDKGCADHVLFGTDTYSVGFQRGRIENAPISDEDKLKILRLNALKLFPVLEK